MAIIARTLFGNHTGDDPLGTDSRRTSDDNLRALAGSMADSFPNLSDTACTKSGAELNDTTEAGAPETITGGWSFNTPTTFVSYTEFTGNSIPIRLTQATNQTIQKTGPGDLRLDCVDTGQEVRIRIGGSDRLRIANALLTAAADLTVNGDVSAANLDLTGNATVNGALQLANSTARAGNPQDPSARIPVNDENGVFLGYMMLWSSDPGIPPG